MSQYNEASKLELPSEVMNIGTLAELPDTLLVSDGWKNPAAKTHKFPATLISYGKTASIIVSKITVMTNMILGAQTCC